MRTIAPASGYGSGRSSTPWTMLNMAVFPPMPNARMSVTVAAKPGLRLKPRRAWRTSRPRSSSQRQPHASRVRSRIRSGFPSVRCAARRASFSGRPASRCRSRSSARCNRSSVCRPSSARRRPRYGTHRYSHDVHFIAPPRSALGPRSTRPAALTIRFHVYSLSPAKAHQARGRSIAPAYTTHSLLELVDRDTRNTASTVGNRRFAATVRGGVIGPPRLTRTESASSLPPCVHQSAVAEVNSVLPVLPVSITGADLCKSLPARIPSRDSRGESTALSGRAQTVIPIWDTRAQ